MLARAVDDRAGAVWPRRAGLVVMLLALAYLEEDGWRCCWRSRRRVAGDHRRDWGTVDD
jgi:hypothetical protein